MSRPPIRVQDVWARDCPLLRHAYDIQTLAAVGIHPRDADTYLQHWRAYDERRRLDAHRKARAEADEARLQADIADFHRDHPNTTVTPLTPRTGTRPRAPRRRIPTNRAA